MAMVSVQLPCTLRELSGNLRTPLTGILGLARLLQSETYLTQEQREMVEGIETSGEALRAFADKLIEAKNL